MSSRLTQYLSVSSSWSDSLRSSYIWMFFGLAISGVASWLVVSNSSLSNAILTNGVFVILLVVELVLVFILSGRIFKMSYSSALVAYVAYAALNGVTLSAVLVDANDTSLATAFAVTALLFAAMAAYGSLTKNDLSSAGSFLFMGLLGLVLASVVNIVLQNDVFSYILSYITVAVFIGLTAYDAQKLKQLAAIENSPNVGLYGALTLYLDFINIFLSLFNIFGSRRRN